MNPGARAALLTAYGRLVTGVWSDPEAELQLERDPRALLARYGLLLPEAVGVEVTRGAPDAASSPDDLVAAWENAPSRGSFTLVVPAAGDDGTELAEHELDSVVAGLGTSWVWSYPCRTR